jgi:hypothetical protein
LERAPADLEQLGDLMVPAAPGVVCRHGALTEHDIVRFGHGDIEVQIRRQFKRFSGLS